MTLKLLALFVAGGCGALSRFGLSTYLTSAFKGGPWGTAIVNLIGCFCFGLIAALFAARSNWDPQIKTIVLTGFFGAFTTFSTYMFEFNGLLREGAYLRAGEDFLLQNGGGLVAVIVGAAIAKRCLLG